MAINIVPITDIIIAETRQRKEFNEREMLELKESIFSSKGLMMPILLRQEQDGLHLVAGERRLRTIRDANLAYTFGDTDIPAGHVPCVIKNYHSEVDWVEAELHENVVRANLTWQERQDAEVKLYQLYERTRVANPKKKLAEKISVLETKGDKAYPQKHTYSRINEMVMLDGFKDDPAVRNAKSRAEAVRIATQKTESIYMEQISKMPQAAPSLTPTSKSSDVLLEGDALTEDQINQKNPLKPLDLSVMFSKPSMEEKFTALHGDCVELLKKLPDNSVDVVLTDPPYGVNANKFGSLVKNHDYEDDPIETAKMMRQVIPQISRVMKDNAHVYMFCDFSEFNTLSELFTMHGWRIRRTPLVWITGVKGALPEGTGQGYRRTFELILLAQKGARPFAKVRNDVFDTPVVAQKLHGAEKPRELLRDMLTMSCVPGDKVLDPFCGSGSIFLAARGLHLDVTGIEKQEKYFHVANARARGEK